MAAKRILIILQCIYLHLCNTMVRCCSVDNLEIQIKAVSEQTKLMEAQSSDASRSSLSLGVAGDLMFDSQMMSSAFSAPKFFRSLFHFDVLDLIKSPDLFYANFEGASAHGLNRNWEKVKDPGMVVGDVYGWEDNSINHHPKLATDLSIAGVDVVSLANNHCMDRGHIGLVRTIDALNAGALQHFGTRRDAGTCDGWYTIVNRNGWNVAWVGCTDKVRSKRGRYKDSDKRNQVLFCKSPEFLSLVATLSRKPGIDAVIATVHWGGREDRWSGIKADGNSQRGACYSTNVTDSMRTFARTIVDSGAAAVLGSHPHVLMEWETYTSKGRRALIAYSLGNVISRQALGPGSRGSAIFNCRHKERISAEKCRRRLGSHAIMFFNLTRTADGPSISCFSYVETSFAPNLMMEELVHSHNDSASDETFANTVLGSRWKTSRKQFTCFPLSPVAVASEPKKIPPATLQA
jgi:poly-gamma-glutamate synthesis protein (capsule biosynthesis protein)